MQSIVEILAQELGQNQKYVENVVQLIDEGNTIPFIARYRKEMHGAMDDTTLRNLETRLTYLRNLQQRREEIKKSIENQGKLTQELSAAIDGAAPGVPLPGKRGWTPWHRQFLPRMGRILMPSPRSLWMKKKEFPMPRRPSPGQATLLRKIYPTMPISANPCGN